MGPQFARLQTFSIKPNKSGNSIEQVLGEVMRDAEFSQHIENPEPPELIYGVDVPTLKVMHDEMLDSRKTSVMVKGKERKRAIRKDRNSLMTAISSFLVPVADLDKDGTGETRRRYQQWIKLNTDYLKLMYGDQLKTIMQHTDEEYPHIHAYILPDEDPGAFAINLHPGEVAKAEAAKIAKADGIEGDQINKIANAAYKAEMRRWQDSFYEGVGAPCGLTRDGPKRARETRAQWQSRKATASITAKVIEENEEMSRDLIDKARKVEDHEDDLRDHGDSLDKWAEDIRADLMRQKSDIRAKADALQEERRLFEIEKRALVDELRAAWDVIREAGLGDTLTAVKSAVRAVFRRSGDDLSM